MCAAPTTFATPAGSRSARVGVLATGASLAGAAVYVAAFDPSVGGWFPACPFHTVTGWWCPGCGLTRATHHLLTGDVAGALSAHLFVPLVLAAIVVGWWSTLQAARGRPTPAWPRRIPVAVWVGLGVLLGVFTVLRNLPAFDALAP